MRLRNEHIILGGAVLALVAWSSMFKTRLINKLASFIPSVEGFEPHPYWDEKRYSWGYGTEAPGSTGTITREQAFADMLAHLFTDYAKLENKITRNLNVNQWAALLSFSYNLGIGNALELVLVINQGDDRALFTKWARYIYSGGSVNQTLVARREKEINLWQS